MAGLTATVSVRRLPDSWAEDCPRCHGARRNLSVTTRLGGRHINETIIAYCERCWTEEGPS